MDQDSRPTARVDRLDPAGCRPIPRSSDQLDPSTFNDKGVPGRWTDADSICPVSDRSEADVVLRLCACGRWARPHGSRRRTVQLARRWRVGVEVAGLVERGVVHHDLAGRVAADDAVSGHPDDASSWTGSRLWHVLVALLPDLKPRVWARR